MNAQIVREGGISILISVVNKKPLKRFLLSPGEYELRDFSPFSHLGVQDWFEIPSLKGEKIEGGEKEINYAGMSKSAWAKAQKKEYVVITN